MKYEILQLMQKGRLVFKSSSKKGFSLVEVLLSGSLFGLIVAALLSAYLYGQESSSLSGNRARAVFLAEEGLEAVRNIRDEDYANLTNGTHGLDKSTNEWIFSGSSDTTGIFDREVVIADDGASRKSITVNVDWQQNQVRTGLVSLVTRLTEWMALGIGDWSAPSEESDINLAGNNNGLKVAVSGDYAIMVRQGGTDFAVIDISNTSAPSLVGSLTLAGNPLGVFISGNYAYVTSTNNAQELIIIDISTPSAPVTVGTYNGAGNSNGRSVFVSGNYAYLARQGGTDFEIIDISTPASPTLTGSLTLAGVALDVVVSGNYAYVASSSNGSELQAIDISTPSAPTLADTINFAGNANALTVAIEGNTVFAGQGDNLRAVDVSTPTAMTLLGSYDATDTINDVSLNFANGGTYAFLATSANASEFQIVDVSTPAAMTLLGSINTGGNANLNGVIYDSSIDRVIGVSSDNDPEFYIFQPA